MLTCEEEAELIDEMRARPDDRWLLLLLRAKCKKVCMCVCVCVRARA